jgi:hypothetical protein
VRRWRPTSSRTRTPSRTPRSGTTFCRTALRPRLAAPRRRRSGAPRWQMLLLHCKPGCMRASTCDKGFVVGSCLCRHALGQAADISLCGCQVLQLTHRLVPSRLARSPRMQSAACTARATSATPRCSAARPWRSPRRWRPYGSCGGGWPQAQVSLTAREARSCFPLQVAAWRCVPCSASHSSSPCGVFTAKLAAVRLIGFPACGCMVSALQALLRIPTGTRQ